MRSDPNRTWGTVVVTAVERHLAAVAYSRPVGNRDVDIDPDGEPLLYSYIVDD